MKNIYEPCRADSSPQVTAFDTFMKPCFASCHAHPWFDTTLLAMNLPYLIATLVVAVIAGACTLVIKFSEMGMMDQMHP